jgi:mannose-6-phosphate isomerase-like protein (cupin superfamily)
VEVLENAPERFVVVRTLPPETGKTANHWHEEQVERFEVLEGSATGALRGQERRLTAGDVLEVPLETPHVHPYTSAGETATVKLTIEPRPPFVEVYFASWFRWLNDGRVDKQEEPPLLGIMAIIREGGGGSWLKGPPIAMQKALASVLGRVAALRGYRFDA